jgi:hypothetical protein
MRETADIPEKNRSSERSCRRGCAVTVAMSPSGEASKAGMPNATAFYTNPAPLRRLTKEVRTNPPSPITAFGRSRPAADASREVVDRWLLDALM